MRDLLVAGGGPVGLATALYAARSGLDVAVLEPRTGVIDKACGEGLMPGALQRLRELGVHPPGQPIAGIRYLDGRRCAQADFRHGPGRGVRRTVLHAALADALLGDGTPVLPRAVRLVEERGDHLLVDGEPTRYLIAADGLHSPVRRLVGLDDRAPRAGGGRGSRSPRRYGQRLHAALAPWSGHVEVHWASRAEAYVTPVAPDLVGVAVLSEQRRSFADLIGDFPELAERLSAATTGDVRGAGPLRQRVRRRSAGRVLLVGDAAGYVDALTGEGIALGLAQAEAAVAAVVSGRAEDYDRVCRSLVRRHDLLTRGLLALTRSPQVRAGLVPAAARLPWVFSAAVNQLARPA